MRDNGTLTLNFITLQEIKVQEGEEKSEKKKIPQLQRQPRPKGNCFRSIDHLFVLLLVVLPDPVVQHSCQGQPSLVGHEQVAGRRVDAMKGDGSGGHGAPEQQQLIESLKDQL